MVLGGEAKLQRPVPFFPTVRGAIGIWGTVRSPEYRVTCKAVRRGRAVFSAADWATLALFPMSSSDCELKRVAEGGCRFSGGGEGNRGAGDSSAVNPALHSLVEQEKEKDGRPTGEGWKRRWAPSTLVGTAEAKRAGRELERQPAAEVNDRHPIGGLSSRPTVGPGTPVRLSTGLSGPA